MEGYIKQSTAHTFQMGPFIDDTDGSTAETGLTIAYTDIFLSKHGGAAAAKNDTTNLTGTGDARGYYDCVLNTTDTNTVGCFKVMAHITGALPVWHTFEVLPANVYDSLVAGTDYLDVNTAQIEGADPTDTITASVPTVAAIQAEMEENGASLLDTIADAVAALNDPSAADIADAVWDESSVGHTDAGKAGQQLWTDVDAILDDTNELQTDDVPTLIAALPTASEIQTEMEENGASLLDTIADAIAALNDPTAAAIADAVWDEAATGHVDAGKAGAQLWTDVDAILADTGELQTNQGNWTTAVGFSTHSAADVVDNFETQSQADPTGFHVNVMEVNGTAQTAGDIINVLSGLNDITAADVWDATEAITGNTLSFETIMARLYRFFFNKMNITDANGNVALRNEADAGDIMTNNISDNDTTTTRTAGTWA